MRILVVSAAVPFPPHGGGLQRTFQITRALASRHSVTMAALTFGEPHAPPPFPLRLETVAWEEPPLWSTMRGDDPDAARAAEEALVALREPWLASWYDVPAMEALVARLAREGQDLVWFEGTDMSRFSRAVPSHVPLAIDLMDLESRRARRDAERLPSPARELGLVEAERALRFEREAASRCRIVLACSSPEARAAVETLGIARVHVVPNGVDTSAFQPGPAGPGSTILFTGTMSYAPNASAARELALDILPRVLEEVPSARLVLAGVDPEGRVAGLASEHVVVRGQQPDIRPLFHEAAVFAAPIRSGGGTRLKLLEAAACGKAIVTTPLGAEGLDLEDGTELVLAEAAADMAVAIAGLLRDGERARKLGAAARRAALRYDWEPIGRDLLDLLERELGTPRGERG